MSETAGQMSGMYRKPDPAPRYKPMHHVPGAASDEKAGRSRNFWLTLAVGLLFLGIVAVTVLGCNLPPIQPVPVPLPTFTPAPAPGTPASTKTAVPTVTARATPTGTPGAPTPFPVNSGRAVFRVHDIRSIPLSRTNDNLVAFVLTSETEGIDTTQPVIEIALRGYTSEPCIRRQTGRPQPCGDKAGWVPRFTANIAYDRTLNWGGDAAAESEKIDCGSGVNFHQRLAMGELEADGSALIGVEWNHDQVSFDTKADKVAMSLAKPHTARFGRKIDGAPWTRAPKSGWRSWLWSQYQAGVAVDVVSWRAVAPIGLVTGCP